MKLPSLNNMDLLENNSNKNGRSKDSKQKNNSKMQNILNNFLVPSKKIKIKGINAPNSRHQRIISLLCYILWCAPEIQRNIYSFIIAPFSILIDNKNVQPDLSIFLHSARGCISASLDIPDIIMEILSPSNSEEEYEDRINSYMMAGVKEYWSIDPIHNEIKVIYSDDCEQKLLECNFHDIISSRIWSNFKIDFNFIRKVLLCTKEFWEG